MPSLKMTELFNEKILDHFKTLPQTLGDFYTVGGCCAKVLQTKRVTS